MVMKSTSRRAQVVHELEHLVPLLAEPDHDAGLGEDGRIDLLHLLQQADGVEIARAGADLQVLGRHRFEVVVEHVGLGRDHDLERAGLAQEVGRQDLDGGLRRAGADGVDHVGEMLRAAISEVVAVDRGDDHVLETELLHRLGDAFGLVRIERLRQAGLHVAEGAGAGAGVAHDHEGGVLLLPALADIGAARLLADRHELVLAHDPVGLGPFGRAGRLDADPVGLALLNGLIGPMRLFRMAGALILVQQVENDGHEAKTLEAKGTRPFLTCR